MKASLSIAKALCYSNQTLVQHRSASTIRSVLFQSFRNTNRSSALSPSSFSTLSPSSSSSSSSSSFSSAHKSSIEKLVCIKSLPTLSQKSVSLSSHTFCPCSSFSGFAYPTPTPTTKTLPSTSPSSFSSSSFRQQSFSTPLLCSNHSSDSCRSSSSSSVLSSYRLNSAHNSVVTTANCTVHYRNSDHHHPSSHRCRREQSSTVDRRTVATEKTNKLLYNYRTIQRHSLSYYHTEVQQFQYRMANLWQELPTPNVIFVLGGPGSGKGTQCTLIAQKYGYVHLSAGDLLRKEQNTPGSEFGELIDGHIRNGTIVPVEITCSLLENAMLEHMISLRDDALAKHKSTTGDIGDDVSSGDNTINQGSVSIPVGNFLIDGFPRNQNNLEGWKKQVADKINLKFVLFFECPKDVCVQRCLERGKNSGRADDNPESMAKRLDTYMNQTMPIINFYDEAGLVKRVDAEKDVDEVFKCVSELIDSA